MLESKLPHPRELSEITTRTDTRDYLAHATRQAKSYNDYEVIIDVDAHTSEGRFWKEICEFLENDVLAQTAEAMLGRNGGLALLNVSAGTNFQSIGGRIPHQHATLEDVEEGKGHNFVQHMRRSMDAMGIDYQVVFPSAMLTLGMHPMGDVEYYVSKAFNRWVVERILPDEKRLLCLLYLPFQSPDLCIEMIRQYADKPGVIGFSVSCVRNNPVYHPSYMKLYRAIEETGKPLVFHTAYNWTDPSFAQLNRFGAMHALSFSHYNLIHLTNWLFNALPERFPKLKVMWVEAGVAWLPYLMQRLDHEVMMRPSEAPGLKRLPSDYMRDMYYTSQPLERHNMKVLEVSMDAMNAETQMLFASDWPHWDFDPPSSITTLPFLSDQAKRNILGLNAAKLFNIPVKRVRPQPTDMLEGRGYVVE
jgi:predicted TIM-barrel fold metal-dependent hydrolase